MTDPADYGLPTPAYGPPQQEPGHDPRQPGALPPGEQHQPRGGPSGSSGGGFRWWYAALPAIVVVVLLVVLGVRALTSGDAPTPSIGPLPGASTTTGTATSGTATTGTATTGTATTGPADPGTPVAPSAVTVTPLPHATRVRFEVFSPATMTAPVAVRYGSDNVSPTQAVSRGRSFAVEAPLTPANDYLSLSASDLDTQAVVMCRLLLDDVLVSLDVGKGYASCSTSRSTTTPTQASGNGAKLAPAKPVAPGRVTVPQLAPSPTTVTYQVSSSQPGGRVDVSYGTNSSASIQKDAEAAPFAVRMPITTSSDFLGVSATNVDDPGPYLVCQLRVDGVLVEQSQGFRSASCDISPDQLYG